MRLFLLPLLLFMIHPLHAEQGSVKRLTVSGVGVAFVEVPAGAAFHFLNVESKSTGYIHFNYGGGKTLQRNVDTFSKSVVYGPLTVSVEGLNTDSWIVVDYSISVPTSGVALELPSNAVVIPADSAGPVQIILESSIDMVNWSAALPGSYATSTDKRFFRVRAVREE